MMRGKLITIEGTEGAGKSTAIALIRECLASLHLDAVFTREPGGTVIAESIREVLLNAHTQEKMQPETELLLMFAGRAQHIGYCILPALQAGKWVVSDRYIDASYAYQGGGRGIAIEKIDALDKMVVGQLYPDLTLLLDVPADVGLARAAGRGNGKDRIEQEQLDFFERVRSTYLSRAKHDPKRMKVIDAALSPEQVRIQIQDVLTEFIKSSE